MSYPLKPPQDAPPSTDAGLRHRAQRERAARLEAEAIAERTTRAFYDKQREVSLLQAVATAANEAKTPDEAFQVTLDYVCDYTGWPVGHVYTVERGDESPTLQPTKLWHLDP